VEVIKNPDIISGTSATYSSSEQDAEPNMPRKGEYEKKDDDFEEVIHHLGENEDDNVPYFHHPE